MKMKIKMPVIVEGKYDKIKLLSYIDATVVTTDGFGIFKNEAKREYIKKLCKDGVIIATDSDGAGAVIRGHLGGMLPADRIHNVYIPQIKGRERRKKEPSKEGFLGVEGMDGDTVRRVFSPFASDGCDNRSDITRADLYRLGLCGGENSAKLRKKLCKRLDLPVNLSAKALCEVLCRLYTREEAEELTEKIKEEKE